MAGRSDDRAPRAGRNPPGDAAFTRGDQLAADGDLTGAESAYREADDAGHPTAAAKLGMLLEARGDGPEAQAALERADERGDGLGAFRLGLLLSSLDRWDDARAAWARADERGRDDAGVDLEPLIRRHRAAEATAGIKGSSPSALTNPVLVGAVTVLVIMVAVFLAYNANEGLPFVPTRELKVDVASGSDLVPGNEVREGGFLVGVVQSMTPVQLPSGQVAGQLTLQLNQAYGQGAGGFDGVDSAVVGVGVEVRRFACGWVAAGVCGWGDVADCADAGAGAV